MSGQVKYIFLPYMQDDMWEVIYSSLIARDDCLVVDPLRERVGRVSHFLYDLHKSFVLNKKIEIPGQAYWLGRNEKLQNAWKTSSNSVELIVVHETSPVAYSKSAIACLRKMFPNAKVVFQGLNDLYPDDKRIFRIESSYDRVITMVPSLSEKYGWAYHEAPYGRALVDDCPEKASDVFFLGLDKGRLPLLVEFYDAFEKQGKTCRFFVMGAQDRERYVRPGIVFIDEAMTYRESLEWVLQTSCLLEVVAAKGDYPTLRTMEAMTYCKHLISTNQLLPEQYYFNPSFMHAVKDASELDYVDFDSEIDGSAPACCDLNQYIEFLKQA